MCQKLPLVASYPSIFLSHDWPLGIERYGDLQQLLRAKPFFKDEIASNSLGSPPLMGLMEILKPAYWFSAHLHVKYAALFKHDGGDTLLRGEKIASVGEVAKQQQHGRNTSGRTGANQIPVTRRNPDEVVLESDHGTPDRLGNEQNNPDELLIDDEEGEEKTSIANEQASIANESEDTRNTVGTDNPDEVLLDDDEEETQSPQTTAEQHIHLEGDSASKTTLVDQSLADGINESVAALEQNATPTANPDEIAMEDEDVAESVPLNATLAADIPPVNQASLILNAEAEATRFLALSKCLPGKDFLQVCLIIILSRFLPRVS